MNLFDRLEVTEHEQVVHCYDPSSGLKAIIAIHDTTLGPALGGTRLLPYATEEEALLDVLRLSRGMTYKAACAGLPLGGGKSVIIADPSMKSEAFFRAYGRFVHSLGGRYITAEDMNTNVENMDWVRHETSYVVGVSQGYGGSGDPSVMTALGAFAGIRAAVLHRYQKTDMSGIRITVQGLGSVGKYLCQLLYEQGVQLFVQDIDESRAQEMKESFGATIVSENELFDLNVDVYAPCARGATLNTKSLSRLKAKIIAGCANNQLENESIHGAMIHERRILYCPDFVINAGGLINVSNELSGYNPEKARNEVLRIADTLQAIFKKAEAQNIPTHEAALRYAEHRIQGIRQLKPPQNLGPSFIGQFNR